jgi:hypothetical protein
MMDSKSVQNVGFFTKIELSNSASHWLLLEEYITKHGPLNVKSPDIMLYLFCDHVNCCAFVSKFKIY